MPIDNRTIICACGNADCKIGVRFDSEPNVMIVTNHHDNDCVIYLDNENIDKLIAELKSYKTKSKKKC